MGLEGYTILRDRGVLALSGADVREFLQGLISNDIRRLTSECSLYAALLTPQGKYLFDFLLYDTGESIWLDVATGRAAALMQRLLMYRLRSKVEITDRSAELAIVALPAGSAGLPPERGATRRMFGGCVAVDPRLDRLGVRAVLPRERVAELADSLALAPAPAEAYETLRLRLGVPAGGDLVVEKSLLLESGFEELAGVAFDKGCFVGQELTARTKHRALVRKRLLPVEVEGPLPVPGTTLFVGGREAGEMRGGAGRRGMALLRLEMLGGDGVVLTAGEARVTPVWPDWLARPCAE